jgi:hypothetical protein
MSGIPQQGQFTIANEYSVKKVWALAILFTTFTGIRGPEICWRHISFHLCYFLFALLQLSFQSLVLFQKSQTITK